jgi:hypothetical protein
MFPAGLIALLNESHPQQQQSHGEAFRIKLALTQLGLSVMFCGVAASAADNPHERTKYVEKARKAHSAAMEVLKRASLRPADKSEFRQLVAEVRDAFEKLREQI